MQSIWPENMQFIEQTANKTVDVNVYKLIVLKR
jgi:hypothetical protein